MGAYIYILKYQTIKKNVLKDSHSMKQHGNFFFNIENGHVYTIFIRPLKEMLYVTAV